MENIFHISQTPSTNSLLRKMIREKNLPEGYVVHTDFQSDGKGQVGSAWESEAGKNLLFSTAIFPKKIKPTEQFIISQLVSIAIKNVLDEYTENITIKWPNDIYWKDKKLAGILIENALQGADIKSAVIGIGLNVNQTHFVSDAPNPISLKQITGIDLEITHLLEKIHAAILELYQNLNREKIRENYSAMLYRKNGFHAFRTEDEVFKARILTVHSDGALEVETESGDYQKYYFKEISFIP